MTSLPAAAEQLPLFDLPPVWRVQNPKGDESWGYFFATRDGRAVKHGHAKQIPRRRGDLQTGNHQPLVLMGAYPAFSRELEESVKGHFQDLRIRDDGEWFAPKTLEFKLVALGDGLPPELLGEWASAVDERRQLLQEAKHLSMQMRITELRDYRSGSDHTGTKPYDRFRQKERILQEGLRQLGRHQDPWFLRQPFTVAVDQIWEARLEGRFPFQEDEAELRVSSLIVALERNGRPS